METQYAHWKRILKEKEKMAKKKCDKVITDCRVTPLIDLRAKYDKHKDEKKEKFLKKVNDQACLLLPDVESDLVEYGTFNRNVPDNDSYARAVSYRLQTLFSDAGYVAIVEIKGRFDYTDSYSVRPHKTTMLELTISLKK